VKTIYVIVFHRRTGRAYSYNEDFEILEPLILDLEVFRYKTVREYWKPMLPNTPLWAARIRDTEFDSFWVR
jgi:hypothetical protein